MTTNLNQYIYANGQNLLTDSASLSYFASAIQPVGYLGTSQTAELQALNNILLSYNLKRASCLQALSPTNPDAYIIRVLVPINPNDKATIDTLSKTALGQFYIKIGYQDVVATIPKSDLKTLGSTYLDPASTSCQNLYVVYCKNMIAQYMNGNNGVLDDGFITFRPECACFVPIPNAIEETGINVSPICIMPGCDNVSGVYLDPVSRSNMACNLTICQSKINFANLAAGGNVDIESKLNQTCGTGESNQVTQSTPAPLQTETTNALSNIPIVSSINNTSLGEYINTNINSNATTYLVGGSVSLSILCIVIIIIALFAILYFKN